MAKLKMPSDAAKALTVPERLLLLCVAAGIDFKHAKIAEKVVTEVVVNGVTTWPARPAEVLSCLGRLIMAGWRRSLRFRRQGHATRIRHSASAASGSSPQIRLQRMETTGSLAIPLIS